MVQLFQSLESQPTVWICYPAPSFSGKFGIKGRTIRTEMVPIIDDVAKETGAQLIDLYAPLFEKPDLFADTVHPNAQGATVLAKTVYEAITEKSDRN